MPSGKHNTCFFVVPALLLLLCTLLADAQMLSLGNRKRETLQFKAVKNLIIVPLYINGKGPFNFVVDTGVGLFLVTDPTLIDSLKIQSLRNIKITGFGEGEDLSAYVTPSLKINIGNSISGDIPAAILKKDAFDLSGYAGMPVHGLIGYELFNSFIVRIDYVLNTLTIYNQELAYIPRKGTRIPITIEEHKPYLVSEIVLSPGKKISAKLIIDSGAGHPVSLETNNGLPFDVSEKNIPANLGVGLNGAIKGFLGRIPSMTIGKFELKNVISAFPDYKDIAAKISSISRNGNLGNNILKRFSVVFDYSRETMYLRPSMLFKEPFEHDMSGMELVAAGDHYDRVIVSRVEKNSAADDVGIAGGDEIVSINFKRVSQMSMAEIDELFRSKNERGVLLEILPKGLKDTERVILTLKRRI